LLLNFELPNLLNSPVITILIVIVIPLVIFSLYLWKFVIPRTNTQPVNVQAVETPTPRTNENITTIEAKLGVLEAKLDRVEGNITKSVNSGIEQIRSEFISLVEKMENLILAVKSAQSDNSSPFNLQSAQEFPALEKDQKNEVIRELGNSDLKTLLVSCAVLEILNYNREQIDLLYEIGVLSPKHLEMIDRVQEIIARQKRISAKEVAQIALQALIPASFGDDLARLSKTLRKLGGGNAN
jgi:hypothetical protein